MNRGRSSGRNKPPRRSWESTSARPETFAALKGIYGPHRLIDLVLLMGAYANTAALLAAVDMQLHAGKIPVLPIPLEGAR